MKLLGNFTGKLFACVTAFALISSVTVAQADTMKQGSAKVRYIKGTAKYSADAGAWIPLKVGTTLKPGSPVQTMAESIVDLDLGDNGPVVRVTPNTTVSIDKLTKSGSGSDSVIETKLNVQIGTIIGNVKKLAKASKYEIKTPNGVAGIRGTDYVIAVIKLADGTYEVTYSDITGTLVIVALVDGKPETVVLNAGESWTPGSNVKPILRRLLEYYREQIALALAHNTPLANIPPPPPSVYVENHVSPTIGSSDSSSDDGGEIIIGEGNYQSSSQTSTTAVRP